MRRHQTKIDNVKQVKICKNMDLQTWLACHSECNPDEDESTQHKNGRISEGYLIVVFYRKINSANGFLSAGSG